MRTLLVVGLLGCSDAVGVDAVEQGIGMEPGDDGTGGSCPVWGCGSNTSKMYGIPFIDAHEGGVANDEGYSIVKLEQFVGGDWVEYRADVEAASLRARDLATGVVAFDGAQLEGARFEIYHAPTNISYYLHVHARAEMHLWAQPDPANLRLTPIYRLKWNFKPGQVGVQPMQTPEDICGANPDGGSGGGPMADFYAVLFEDDRFDIDAITVTHEAPDWFNIGCAGHALAKQHLLGHTKAAGTILQATTTLPQRTANLKMITADYCGNGHPFTVPGQPLYWRDQYGWYDTVTGATSGVVEARWTEHGAECLNTPRVDHIWTWLGWQTFPNGVDGLFRQWCGTRPPECRGSTTDMQGSHVISVNP